MLWFKAAAKIGFNVNFQPDVEKKFGFLWPFLTVLH
jgi:hypothetical protein